MKSQHHLIGWDYHINRWDYHKNRWDYHINRWDYPKNRMILFIDKIPITLISDSAFGLDVIE